MKNLYFYMVTNHDNTISYVYGSDAVHQDESARVYLEFRDYVGQFPKTAVRTFTDKYDCNIYCIILPMSEFTIRWKKVDITDSFYQDKVTEELLRAAKVAANGSEYEVVNCCFNDTRRRCFREYVKIMKYYINN